LNPSDHKVSPSPTFQIEKVINSSDKLFKSGFDVCARTFFYIHTNIVTKKWGKKRAKQFFQKHTNSARKKCWEKNRRKKCENFFLYSLEYRDQKMGGKMRETIFPEKHE